MLDTLTRLVQPIVQIRRDEWRRAIPMFLYFAFTIATLYILKPIRTSIFLTAHGAASLRYAYIGEGVFLILVTFGYVRLSAWLARKRTLFSVATLFFIANVLGFWFLFHFHPVEWLAFLFYVWVAAYSITIVTQFWTLANDIFDPREAKRLFGFILSGGSLGGVIGGLVTNQMAQRIGTENLLFVVAGLLAACLVMIHLVMREEPRRPVVPQSAQRDPAKQSAQYQDTQSSKTASETAAKRFNEQSTWKLFLGSRYLLLITALVVITKMGSTLIDNQFNAIVENTIFEKNARTAFFGGFMAFLNVISFVLQLIVASYVLRRLGIGISLLLLPIGLCFGSAATLFFPTLLAACFAKVYDGSMNYSISQMGKEILYIPIKSSVRYRVKPIIDMLGFRASKSMAGVLIIFVTALLGIPDEKLGLVVILLIPLWVLVVWAVRDEYMQTIKQLLASPQEMSPIAAQEKIENVLERLETDTSFEMLKPFLIHPSTPARKIAGVACHLFYYQEAPPGRIKKLAQDMAVDAKLKFKQKDQPLRFHMAPTFDQIQASGRQTKSDARLIRSEIIKAVEHHTSFLAVLNEFKKRRREAGKKVREPYLSTVLEAMRLENLERIFRLLALLYASETILVIYNRLSEQESDASVRAHAIELLENILDPQLAKIVTPALEEDGAAQPGPHTLETVLTSFLAGRDPWFLVGGIFLVEEMGLKGLYSHVRPLVHSPLAMVRDVARIVSDHMEYGGRGRKSGQEAK